MIRIDNFIVMNARNKLIVLFYDRSSRKIRLKMSLVEISMRQPKEQPQTT